MHVWMFTGDSGLVSETVAPLAAKKGRRFQGLISGGFSDEFVTNDLFPIFFNRLEVQYKAILILKNTG